MLPERRTLMIETRNRIQKEFKRLRREAQLNSEVADRMFSLMDKRVKTFGARSFFVNIIYQYVIKQAKIENLRLSAHNSTIFDTKLSLLAEGIITVQYYHNQILDGKGGLYDLTGKCDKSKIDLNLIAGNYVKDFLYNYIEEYIFPKELKKSRKTTQAVRQIFQYVDLGQDIQDRCGTSQAYAETMDRYISVNPKIDKFINKKFIDEFWEIIHSEGIKREKEWFVRNYFLRINLTNGALFFTLAELVMDLLGYYGKRRSNILNFAVNFGILEQVVNDNNDYVLPEAKIHSISKIPEDAFADLRNDNITLPLIFYLHQKDVSLEDIRDMQKSFKSTDCSLEEINNKNKFIKWQQELFPAIKKSIEVTQAMAEKVEDLELVKFNTVSLKWLGKFDWLKILIRNLLPARRSSELFRTKYNPFGSLLLDMNSIASVDFNRYYQHMYASAEKKEINNEIASADLVQTTAEVLQVNGTSTEHGLRISKRILGALLGIGEIVEKSIAQVDHRCRKKPAY